jgi:hypothetical protein
LIVLTSLSRNLSTQFWPFVGVLREMQLPVTRKVASLHEIVRRLPPPPRLWRSREALKLKEPGCRASFLDSLPLSVRKEKQAQVAPCRYL